MIFICLALYPYYGLKVFPQPNSNVKILTLKGYDMGLLGGAKSRVWNFMNGMNDF